MKITGLIDRRRVHESQKRQAASWQDAACRWQKTQDQTASKHYQSKNKSQRGAQSWT